MKKAVKGILTSVFPSNSEVNHPIIYDKVRDEVAWAVKITILAILMLLHVAAVQAQSGGWDLTGTSGATSPNITDHTNGVIQLLNTSVGGCSGAAVHETSDKYDPSTGAVFNECYQVFFGCPGNDDIGSDTKGDGVAFSFSKCGFTAGTCGGGMGYNGGCGQMITFEFDTYSSQGNAGWDANYGGGTSGANDEVAIQKNGDASDAGRITSANAGNLEDGLEHLICISYDPATDVYSVSIDGNNVLTYDATGTGNELETYFGAGGLNQTWSSGKDGANNPVTVSNGADISDNVGAPLCPANVVITSPASALAIGSCEGPVTITAAATPPAGNTVDSVEFFVDGVKIGKDVTDSYQIDWNDLEVGTHALTATAHYSGGSFSNSSAVNVSVGGGVELTTSAPTIDGSIDPIWNNYAAIPMNQVTWPQPAGAMPAAADLSGTYRTMRDATYLYVLVEITDEDLQYIASDNNWDNDGIEVFIDIGNDKAGAYGANDYQYAFVYNNATAIEYKHSPGSLTGVSFAQGAKAGGYIMEIRFPWATLGAVPNAGTQIGFDVHANDDDGGGTRDSKIGWNDALDIAFNNPQGMGTVTASACNPCPSGVLSGDNTICDNGTTTSDISVALDGAGPYSFTYSIDGVVQPAITGVTTSPYVFQSSTGTHTYALVTVTNNTAVGCSANATGTATVTAIEFPIGHDGTFTPPGTATLTVDDLGETYQWYDAPTGGNLVFTGTSFVTPVLTDTAKYYVQIASTATCRVEVKAIPTGEFFIPNLITPNSDGKNDRFEISALPDGSALKVFNRWGDNVYQSTDYDNLWAGNDGADGIYYFDLLLPDGKQFKGWVNVVR